MDDGTNSTTSILHQQTIIPFRGKMYARETVWFGATPEDVPNEQIGALDTRVFASVTGPDDGLAAVHIHVNQGELLSNIIAGTRNWKLQSRKAHGVCDTLYDKHPISGRVSGDPIADCFGVSARHNCACLALADGVNWGDKSRLAARLAIYSCFTYVHKKLEVSPPHNVHSALQILLESFSSAQSTILRCHGGLTTLCTCLVLPLANSSGQFAVCVVNLGDSLAFLWSKFRGVREITVGSHDLHNERDIRDAGGALGPAHGQLPELHNLTCSYTVCDPGDIVFLTSDGITDNFDPVIAKMAFPLRNSDEMATLQRNVANSDAQLLHLSPIERHHCSLKEMERILLEVELRTAEVPSAKELTEALLQHAREISAPKRSLLEDPALYTLQKQNGVNNKSRRKDAALLERLALAPGKLDHASAVAFEVGCYHGDEWEDYHATHIPPSLPLSATCDMLNLRNKDLSFAPDLSDIEFVDCGSTDSIDDDID